MSSLSEDAEKRIGEIKKELIDRHAGEQISYGGCSVNCGGNSCVFKFRTKDGRLTCIEPDDRYNKNIGREDEIVTEKGLIKNKLQQRCCEMGYAWPEMVNHPDRILYPLKRVEGTKRGEGKFERISWDDALDLIAKEMVYCKRRYGAYSIITPYPETLHAEPLFCWFGNGVQGWGWCSMDAGRQAKHFMLGIPGWDYYPWHDMADMLLNSKMLFLIGVTADVQHFGPGHQFCWYMRMAREKGIPVIVIDPRYSATAETVADQWIPIKPGTDMALVLAMAYIIYKEDLYNHDFVEKWVEPRGFEMWRKYIMGEPKGPDNPYGDGVPKTPEWAETICGVPAETIVDLTGLYARHKPTYLYKNWSVARKSHGENVARAVIALQAMMGYIMAGGCLAHLQPGTRATRFAALSLGMPPWFEFPPAKDYPRPRMYRSNRWAQAVLLLDKVASGELSTEEYRKIVGWRADPSLPNPTPSFMFQGGHNGPSSNIVTCDPDSVNDQIKAFEKLRFSFSIGSFMTPTIKYADVVLPMADNTWEDMSGPPSYTFVSYGGVSNFTIPYSECKPQGESKPWMWIFTKIAERLGFVKQYNKYYTTDENWSKDWDRYNEDKWKFEVELIERNFKDYGGNPEKPIPTWKELKTTYNRTYNLDEAFDEPWHPFVDEIERGKGFQTKSGKIEFCAFFMLDEKERGKMHLDNYGRLYDNVPNDWRDQTAIPTYQPCVKGMEDPRVKQYPLMILTPHSRYRVHSLFWLAPHLRNNVYRHSVWLSVNDAKQRGINDEDLCRVFNDKGEMILPAYVTSRISPGVIVVRHGGYYDPSEEGIDWGGASTAVLGGDTISPACPALVTSCVQVEKYAGPVRSQSSFWYPPNMGVRRL